LLDKVIGCLERNIYMLSVGLILCAISGVLELSCAAFITIRAIQKPKRVLCILSAFSILTLPACMCNILAFADYIDSKWNSFCYLFVTLFMLVLHFWLTLDIGRNLRLRGIQWKHPLVIGGIISLCGSLTCLTVEIIILLVRNDNYPLRKAFICGVCFAIVSDGLVYIYSFSALFCSKNLRMHEDQSRTAALGVKQRTFFFFFYLFTYDF
jgi:hypothetical protein